VNWKEVDTSYANAYRYINFRTYPELYRIGKGEQGVLMAEPYKSEILAIGWRFRTPEIAEESSSAILNAFYDYLDCRDFVGADMARKFLMMGWTRARRYANHKSGQKYDANMQVFPQEPDALTSDKAVSAEIFRKRYVEARDNEQYKSMMTEHKRLTGLN
jgi:hypothetical protein